MRQVFLQQHSPQIPSIPEQFTIASWVDGYNHLMILSCIIREKIWSDSRISTPRRSMRLTLFTSFTSSKLFFRRKSRECLRKIYSRGDENVEKTLTGFHDLFSHCEDFPKRTAKHIATRKNSTLKRLNMFTLDGEKRQRPELISGQEEYRDPDNCAKTAWSNRETTNWKTLELTSN